jgi:hypothetical protein
MTDALTPMVGKLAACIRLLSSNRDGDVVAAAHGLMRLLKGVGVDVHALADRIANGGDGLTEAEMKKLYNAGYAAGVYAVESKQQGDFYDVDGSPLPSWHRMARYCQQRGERLRSKEQTFVDEMAARTVYREPTEKQGRWLRSIYHKLGGK